MSSKQIFQDLLERRILFIDGDLTPELSTVVIPHLLFLDSKSKEDITLCINCRGGSIDAGFAIIDMMNFIDCDVRTVCINEAESMGAVILASGTKGKRYSLKDADIMIHQMSGSLDASDLGADVEYQRMKETETMLFKHIAKMTHKSLTKITSVCQKDYWMTAEQAKEFGIIDKIVTDWSPFLHTKNTMSAQA